MTEATDKKLFVAEYLLGYWEALQDFGIWRTGVQHIGCTETPIREAMLKKAARLKVSPEELDSILKWRVNKPYVPNPDGKDNPNGL